MSNKFLKRISITIMLLAALAFVVKFGGPQILRQYISVGIGNCKKIPILCVIPNDEILKPEVDKTSTKDFLTYKFPKMSVSAPKGFSVVQEMIKKYYYKKNLKQSADSIIYVLHEEKGYFIELFSDAKKLGVKDNFEFLRRTFNARPDEIKNLSDAFFVIMKSIFIPDIGDQKTAVMTQFRLGDKYGYITYNLAKEVNYFSCDMTTDTDAYFKIYIKDKGAKLTLNDLFAIITTLAKID